MKKMKRTITLLILLIVLIHLTTVFFYLYDRNINKPNNHFSFSDILLIFDLDFNTEMYNWIRGASTSKELADIEIDPKTLYLYDSRESSTVIAPVLDTNIDKDKNLIYCNTLQMAWNELCRVMSDTIEITDSPDYIPKLNANINQLPMVSDDSYIVMSGIIDDKTTEMIKKAVRQKFNGMLANNELTFDFKMKPRSLFIFSFLFKQLMFQKEFNEKDNHEFNFNNKKVLVKAFGIEKSRGTYEEEMLGQIELFFEPEPNSLFVVKLKTKSESDEIVISNFTPEKTLKKTFDKINEYITVPRKRPLPEPISYLLIPKIDFDIINSFDKLSNKIIISEKLKGFFFGKVIQKVRFKLNEKGARLVSSTNVSVLRGIPRCYNINGPFFIYLKNKNSALPYFMAYIANDELLVKN